MKPHNFLTNCFNHKSLVIYLFTWALWISISLLTINYAYAQDINSVQSPALNTPPSKTEEKTEAKTEATTEATTEVKNSGKESKDNQTSSQQQNQSNQTNNLQASKGDNPMEDASQNNQSSKADDQTNSSSAKSKSKPNSKSAKADSLTIPASQDEVSSSATPQVNKVAPLSHTEIEAKLNNLLLQTKDLEDLKELKQQVNQIAKMVEQQSKTAQTTSEKNKALNLLITLGLIAGVGAIAATAWGFSLKRKVLKLERQLNDQAAQQPDIDTLLINPLTPVIDATSSDSTSHSNFNGSTKSTSSSSNTISNSNSLEQKTVELQNKPTAITAQKNNIIDGNTINNQIHDNRVTQELFLAVRRNPEIPDFDLDITTFDFDQVITPTERLSDIIKHTTIASNITTRPTIPNSPWSIGSSSITGNVKNKNEDYSLCFKLDKYQVVIVADGCGGTPYGQKASYIAVNASTYSIIKDFNINKPRDVSAFIANALNAAATALASEGKKLNIINSRDGLRTTLIIVVADQYNYSGGYIGDGGVFLQRANGHLEKLLVAQKEFSNVLSASLGPKVHGQPVFFTSPRYQGDMLMLGSDGFFDFISEEKLSSVSELIRNDAINHHGNLQLVTKSFTNQFADFRDQHGYICNDNITLVLLVGEQPLSPITNNAIANYNNALHKTNSQSNRRYHA